MIHLIMKKKQQKKNSIKLKLFTWLQGQEQKSCGGKPHWRAESQLSSAKDASSRG